MNEPKVYVPNRRIYSKLIKERVGKYVNAKEYLDEYKRTALPRKSEFSGRGITYDNREAWELVTNAVLSPKSTEGVLLRDEALARKNGVSQHELNGYQYQMSNNWPSLFFHDRNMEKEIETPVKQKKRKKAIAQNEMLNSFSNHSDLI